MLISDGCVLFVICTCVLVLYLRPAQPSMAYGRLHSPLARAVLARMQQDELDRQSDHTQWYSVDLTKLPDSLASKFVQLNQDAETSQFLQNCSEKSDWLFTQLYQSVAKSFLSMFMSQTSVNGLLDRGSMFVFSKSQFQQLLGASENWQAASLLDLGAGDGKVTQVISHHFKDIYVTEVSQPMIWRLQNKGYTVLNISAWNTGSPQYDVISCLNLLDRCDKPVTLLRDMKNSIIKESGRIIVALVLPFKPYVENTANHRPTEYIHLQGTTFEEQILSLTRDVFEPVGLEVVKFTRLPYLCEGDLTRSFYVLHDVIFVLKVS